MIREGPHIPPIRPYQLSSMATGSGPGERDEEKKHDVLPSLLQGSVVAQNVAYAAVARRADAPPGGGAATTDGGRRSRPACRWMQD